MESDVVGLLWDSVSNNAGDQAIGLVMRRFLDLRKISYDVLNPFSYDASHYSTIIVGGGELLRQRGNPFYDRFRAPGAHILNSIGTHFFDQGEYLQNYRLVTVRSIEDKKCLEEFVDEVKVVPCATMLMGELTNKSEDFSTPSDWQDRIGVHLNAAAFSKIPNLFSALEKINRKYRIVFLPFDYYQNDIALMEMLVNHLPGSIISPFRNPVDLYYSISNIPAVISASLHATIFAYSQGIPVLSNPVYPKLHHFMKERGLEDTLFSSSNELLSKLSDLLQKPPQTSALVEEDKRIIRDHLNELAKLCQTKSETELNNDLLATYVKPNGAEVYHSVTMQSLETRNKDLMERLSIQLQMDEKEKQLSNLNELSIKTEQTIYQLRIKLTEKEKELHRINEQSIQSEQITSGLKSKLDEKENELNQLINQSAEIKLTISELKNKITKRNYEVIVLRNSVIQKDQTIQRVENEKRESIEKINNEKEEEIRRVNTEKEEEIRKVNIEKEEEIQRLNIEKEKAIQSLKDLQENENHRYSSELAALRAQIDGILNSRSWRIMSVFQNLRLKIIPLGSKREKLLGLRHPGFIEQQAAPIDPNCPPADEINFRLDTDLSQPFVVGKGNILNLEGWCYHPQSRIKRLFIIVENEQTEITDHSFGRIDVFHQLARCDPSGNSLVSGFIAKVPFKAIDQPKTVEIILRAILDDNRQYDKSLGYLDLQPEYDAKKVNVREIPATDEPLIAICMATYNPDHDLFVRQIQSIIHQSHKNWICIISDDCSKLDFFEDIQKVTSVDNRFIVYRNASNLGLYKNFEKSLTYVPEDADFVAFSDQDDNWYPEKLKRSLEELVNEDDQLVYSDMDIVDQDGKILSHSYWTYRRNNYTSLESLFFANTVTGAASVFRASLLKDILPFPAEFPHAYHDHWIACVALSKGKIKYIDEPIYAYTQHSSNAYGHHKIQSIHLFPEIKRLRDWLRNPGWMKKEIGDTVRQLDDAYVRYLLRLVLLAKILLLRFPDIEKKKRSVLRQIGNFDRSIFGLIYQGIRYKLENRPTLGYEWLALRSYVGHKINGRYYANNRVKLRQYHLQDTTLPAQQDNGEMAMTANINNSYAAGMVNLVKNMISPLQLKTNEDALPRINLLMATINFKYVFGGYIAMFNLAKKLAVSGHRVRIVIVEPCDYNPGQWKTEIAAYPGLEDLFDLVETAYRHDRSIPLEVNPQDVFIATSCWTAQIAYRTLKHTGRKFIFFAQEYEPIFFPMGSTYALSHETYFFPQYTIFSTELLREYFKQNRFGVYSVSEEFGSQNSISFRNAINKFEVSQELLANRSKKKLLFYARPEQHASRNMFELGILGLMEAIEQGCFNLEEWEFDGIGSVGAFQKISLGCSTEMQLLPKVSLEEYLQLLPQYDLGISLMLSPHPSLMPLEMASAGMLSITNTYANKTADKLSAISSNIVAVSPTIEGIAQGIRIAINRINNYEERVSGANVDWCTDWEEAFNPDFINKVNEFITLIKNQEPEVIEGVTEDQNQNSIMDVPSADTTSPASEIKSLARMEYDAFDADLYMKQFPGLIRDMPKGFESFNEMKYLELNPDIAKLVAEKHFATGWDHYIKYGQFENRAISDSTSVPLPPLRLMVYIGSHNPNGFINVGSLFRQYLIDLCGLKPDHKVLEVGCGCGRMAIPLTDYLSEEGRYYGFDIDDLCINWAQENITKKRPNFSFLKADVFNHYYNPSGKNSSVDYRFPYEDKSFDIILLTSVFTHMFPDEMEHYLKEISRVLKVDGKCMITAFVINDESLGLVKSDPDALGIVHSNGKYWTSNPRSPEEAIGFDEPYLRRLYTEADLNIDAIHFGNWCNREQYTSYQDIIIATKRLPGMASCFGDTVFNGL